MIENVARPVPGTAAVGRLAEILDGLASGVTVQDENLRLVYANQTAAELSGFASAEEMLAASPTELLGRFDLIDETGAPLPISRLPARLLLAGEDAAALIVGFRIRATGEERWSIVQARLLEGGDGAPRLAVNTFHDLTSEVEERRVSLALLEAERKFHELTDSAPMLVWMAGPDGGHTFVNRGWLVFTGRSLEEELGDGWFSGIHPEDVERRGIAFRRAFKRREPFEIEYRLRRHDGVYRWILDIGTPRFGTNGEFLGYLGSSLDIEERKRAGDLSRLMADAALRLDETLQLDETVIAAAGLAIPEVADWCVIDLLQPDGSYTRAAVVAKDPGQRALLEPLAAVPTMSDTRRPGARAVRDRKPIFIGDLRDERTLRDNTAGSEELRVSLATSGARSAIVQPLSAHGEILGAMFFVVGPDRAYVPADVAVTTELARRVALAISNALIHGAEQEARRAAEAAAERTTRLQRLTRLLADAASVDAAANIVVREGRIALDASGALVALRQDAGISIVAHDGYDAIAVKEYQSLALESQLPLARAIREGKPVWMPELGSARADGSLDGVLVAASPNSSVCAVPLSADGTTFGTMGLSFAEPHAFEPEERALIETYADLCAQALARVALTAIRERLVGDLEAERARLETLLRQLPEGLLIAESPSGRIVLANNRVEEMLGIPAGQLHHIAGGEAYRGFDVTGRELLPEDWPLARAVKGETVAYAELELVRADGTRIWVAKRAGPVLDREGKVVAGVATIIDISEARRLRESRQFLADATELLSSSLDYEETIRRVADLAVPRIADWCAVELVEEGGATRTIAVSHVDPAKVEQARILQERYPPHPDAPRGSAAVIRTGQSDMLSNITQEMIDASAADDNHREMLRALEVRGYICVPLIANGHILGALTLVTSDPSRSLGPDDLALAEAIAARAASAIENARLFREGVRYKRVLDATLDAVIMFDPLTLRISYANQGASDQVGYRLDDLIGAEATMFVEDLDAIGLRGIVAPLVSGQLDARTVTMSYRHIDGRMIPVEVLFQHITPPGEPGRIVAVARDIADRLEAQANLRRLAESEHARAAELNAVIRAMGEGVFVCAADGRIALSNPAAEAVFPETEEQSYSDLLAELEDPAALAPALGKVGGPVELRARGAEDRWIELSTYPVVRAEGDEEGEAGETIVMVRDVTLARQRQAIRDTFIGVLSHELRTPVTTIYAGSKVLARDGQLSEATRQEIFSDIVVEAERLHRLVEDVIAMTRFGEDEGEVGTEPVLVQRLVPNVVGSEQARWPGVRFELDLPPALPTAIADPTYVEQVMRNLLSNAAKYGGPGVTVRLSVEADADEVIVRIVDDGPGFPAEEAEQLFELFFRSERTAAAAAGAGIGLFVCARLIRAMGGRIWAMPGPRGGAEFGFTLRVLPDE